MQPSRVYFIKTNLGIILMNSLDKRVITGTTGELLVQLRLFQYGVQANPPLKDSGNDLIAVRGDVFRAIQVKTTAVNGNFEKPKDRLYHILAFVRLEGDGAEIFLDQSSVYLMSKEYLESDDFSMANIEESRISQGLVDLLFQP